MDLRAGASSSRRATTTDPLSASQSSSFASASAAVAEVQRRLEEETAAADGLQAQLELLARDLAVLTATASHQRRKRTTVHEPLRVAIAAAQDELSRTLAETAILDEQLRADETRVSAYEEARRARNVRFMEAFVLGTDTDEVRDLVDAFVAASVVPSDVPSDAPPPPAVLEKQVDEPRPPTPVGAVPKQPLKPLRVTVKRARKKPAAAGGAAPPRVPVKPTDPTATTESAPRRHRKATHGQTTRAPTACSEAITPNRRRSTLIPECPSPHPVDFPVVPPRTPTPPIDPSPAAGVPASLRYNHAAAMPIFVANALERYAAESIANHGSHQDAATHSYAAVVPRVPSEAAASAPTLLSDPPSLDDERSIGTCFSDDESASEHLRQEALRYHATTGASPPHHPDSALIRRYAATARRYL